MTTERTNTVVKLTSTLGVVEFTLLKRLYQEQARNQTNSSTALATMRLFKEYVNFPVDAIEEVLESFDGQVDFSLLVSWVKVAYLAYLWSMGLDLSTLKQLLQQSFGEANPPSTVNALVDIVTSTHSNVIQALVDTRLQLLEVRGRHTSKVVHVDRHYEVRIKNNKVQGIALHQEDASAASGPSSEPGPKLRRDSSQSTPARPVEPVAKPEQPLHTEQPRTVTLATSVTTPVSVQAQKFPLAMLQFFFMDWLNQNVFSQSVAPTAADVVGFLEALSVHASEDLRSVIETHTEALKKSVHSDPLSHLQQLVMGLIAAASKSHPQSQVQSLTEVLGQLEATLSARKAAAEFQTEVADLMQNLIALQVPASSRGRLELDEIKTVCIEYLQDSGVPTPARPILCTSQLVLDQINIVKLLKARSLTEKDNEILAAVEKKLEQLLSRLDQSSALKESVLVGVNLGQACYEMIELFKAVRDTRESHKYDAWEINQLIEELIKVFNKLKFSPQPIDPPVVDFLQPPYDFEYHLQSSINIFRRLRKLQRHNGESTENSKFILGLLKSFLHNRKAATKPAPPKVTPEACRKGLLDIFQFYAKQPSLAERSQSPGPGTNLRVGKFLSFCTDFQLLESKTRTDVKRLQKAQVAKAFYDNAEETGLMTSEGFILAIDDLAKLFFDSNYDEIHKSNYDQLALTEKVMQMYQYLECHDPLRYGKKMKGYGNPYYLGRNLRVRVQSPAATRANSPRLRIRQTRTPSPPPLVPRSARSPQSTRDKLTYGQRVRLNPLKQGTQITYRRYRIT